MVCTKRFELQLSLLGIVILSCISFGQVAQPSTLPTQPFLPLSSYTPGPAFHDSPRGDFGRGSFGLSFGTELLTVVDMDHNALGFFTISAEYVSSKGLAVIAEAELSPGTLELGNDDCLSDARFNLRAGGGMLLLRAYVLQLSNLALYIDGGIGGLHARSFPREDLNDNWVQAIGCGASLRLTSDTYLFGGARYVRLSSDFFPMASSPQSNGIQCYLGVSVRS